MTPLICESQRSELLPQDELSPIDDYSPDATFTSSRQGYISTIHELAVADGFDAEWGRCPEGNLFYVDVWGISRKAFAELLKVAAQKADDNK